MLILFPSLSSQPGCDKRSDDGRARALDSRPLVPLTNMVLIKAGTFIRQKYPITITRDFWISKYEVTQGEYQALVGNNPSHFKAGTNSPADSRSPTLQHPVERVRHSDAVV